MKQRIKKPKKVKEPKKMKEPKKTKEPQIKENNAKYFFRAIVGIVIVIFVVLGLYYVTHYEDSEKIIKNMDNYEQTLQDEEAIRTATTSYAVNFVTAYYSCDTGQQENYEKTVSKFLASGLTLEAPSSYDSLVVTAVPEAIEKSEDGYDVTVRATIDWQVPLTEKEQEEADIATQKENEKATSTGDTKTTPTTKTVRKVQLIRIPMSIDDEGNVAVSSQPFYCADTNSASKVGAIGTLSNKVDDVVGNDITNLTTSFLKAYCGKSKTALDYLVTKDFPKQTLNGAYTFGNISGISIATGDSDTYYADVTYTVKNEGISQNQRMILTIVKTDKYYVSKITTR